MSCILIAATKYLLFSYKLRLLAMCPSQLCLQEDDTVIFWQLVEVKSVFRKWQSRQTVQIEKVKTSSLSSASNSLGVSKHQWCCSRNDGLSSPGTLGRMLNCLRVASKAFWFPEKYAAIALWKSKSCLCMTFTYGLKN